MIARILARLFHRPLTEAEERFRFYFGSEQARKWDRTIWPAQRELINFWSRHCQ